MKDRAFLDTNVVVYMYSEKEPCKRRAAHEILDKYNCLTSIQCLKEASNVWYKKFGWKGDFIKRHLNNIELVFEEILPIYKSTLFAAIDIKEKYHYSFYDCIMLASALKHKCTLFFSEDMNNGQIIGDTLKILNPFMQK